MQKAKRFSKLVIGLLILSAIYFIGARSAKEYENPGILLILNTLFTGIIPITVACMSARSYLKSELFSALLMSCGVLVFGLGSIATGIINYIVHSANTSVTLYNLCAFACAFFHLLSATADMTLKRRPKNRVIRIIEMTCAVLLILLFIVFIIIADNRRILPVFMDENGSTRIRDIILALTVSFLFGACLVYMKQYKTFRQDYLYWYALSLSLIAFGMLTVSLISALGTIVCWLGRITQYIGCLFALISLIIIRKRAKEIDTTVEVIMTEFFSRPQEAYGSVINTFPDAVVSVDQNFKILQFNAGAERLFKYKPNRMANSPFLDMFIAEPYKRLIGDDLNNYIRHGASRLIGNTVEMIAKDTDGRSFPIEISIAIRRLATGYISTYVLRDITKRKQYENTIKQHNTILESINRIYEHSVQSQTLRELAGNCLQIAVEATGSEIGYIGSVQGDAALSDLAAVYPDSLDSTLKSFFSHSLMGSIISQQGTVFSNSLYKYMESATSRYAQIKSFLGVPYMKNGAVTGLIGLANERNGYTKKDKEILEALTPTIFEVLHRKHTEERLRDSEEKFHTFMNVNPCMCIIKDDKGRHVFVNRTWEETFHIQSREALGKSDADLFEESLDLEEINDIYSRIGQTGESIYSIQQVDDKYWDVIRFPFKNASGDTYIGCIAVDITKQKKAEREANRKERLLRSIIENTNEPIYLKDRGGKYQLANTASKKVLGSNDVLGKTDLEICNDKLLAQIIMDNDRRLMSMNMHETLEEDYSTRAGIRTLLSSKAPWHDENGSVCGIIGVSQDITDRIRMEINMKENLEELRHKNELITNFFINISHEFKTPLALIIGNIELMEFIYRQKSLSKEAILNHLATMKLNAYRLNRLIANLLDITKLDAGFSKPTLKNANIVEVLRELIKSVEPYTQLKGLKLNFRSSVPQLNMATDRFIFERIILNLLSNAFKHTPMGGMIQVSLDVLAEKALITVKDTGDGIPADQQNIIFDRFRQVNTTLIRSSEGCGLGLTLSKALVELLDGQITLQSTIGSGSLFIIEFNIRQAAENNCYFEQISMELEKRVFMEFSDLDLEPAAIGVG